MVEHTHRPQFNLLLFIMLLIPVVSFGQPDAKDFYPVLSLKKTGKPFRTGTGIDTSWKTYIGVITDSNNRVKYHVVKEFFKLQAGDTWHGHSNIYFFDVQKKLKAAYDAGMPDDLPYKLAHNTFYFHYVDKGITKTYMEKVKVPLDKWFCTGGSGCDIIHFLP